MAIRPEDDYPGQSNPADAAYPEGSFKNDTAPGSNDGTPVEERWPNDIYGFLQKLLNAAGITPSGNPDTVLASDYFDALDAVIAERISTGGGSASFSEVTVGSPVGGAPAAGGINAEALYVNNVPVLTTADEGAGNGLDADLLDGQHGAFYQDASNLTAGTLPDGRFPATLPAVSGANLTNLNASALASGTVPKARLPFETGSFTTGLLGGGGSDLSVTVAHSLGVDNVGCILICKGSSPSTGIAKNWIISTLTPTHQTVKYLGATADTTFLTSQTDNTPPSSGNILFRVRNTGPDAQTFTVYYMLFPLS